MGVGGRNLAFIFAVIHLESRPLLGARLSPAPPLARQACLEKARCVREVVRAGLREGPRTLAEMVLSARPPVELWGRGEERLSGGLWTCFESQTTLLPFPPFPAPSPPPLRRLESLRTRLPPPPAAATLSAKLRGRASPRLAL